MTDNNIMINYFSKMFQEAQRLAPDEKLQPCPRCTCPSRVTPNEGKAQCSRISCQYEFCTLCLCTFHKGSPCRITRGCKIRNSTPQTSPTSATDSSGCYSKARVSSKVSKRRLKRLWQIIRFLDILKVVWLISGFICNLYFFSIYAYFKHFKNFRSQKIAN